LSVKWHPDKYNGSQKKTARERYQRIKDAYRILSDEQKRREYDLRRGFTGLGTGSIKPPITR